MTKRLVAAGVRDNYLFFYDDNGLLIGGSPDTPAAGAASGAVEILGIQTVPLTTGEPETVPILGDDTVLANFEFDSDQPRSYIVEMAVHDLQLDAWLMGTLIETIAGADVGLMDVNNAPERNCGLIHQGRAKKFDASNQGQKAWEVELVPLATVKPLGRQALTSRAGAVYRLKVTEQPFSKNPWGVTLSSAVAGAESAYYRTMRSDNPMHLVAWGGNGALVNIPLDHVPVSVALSAAWSNLPAGAQGVPLVISAVSTTNKTLTTSALASGTYGAALYQYSKK